MGYTIAETFKLPSNGKFYQKEINPNIVLRSMTTSDEMKRLGQSDRPNYLMASVIDDCLVEDVGISAYDMILPDYQFLLHKLRIVTYGNEYKVNSTCPYCGYTNESTIDLDNLEVDEISDEVNKYIEFDLPKSKHHIKLRMQTPRILDDIVLEAKEAKKKSPNMQGDPAFLLSLEKLIDTVDGERLKYLDMQQFITNMPMMDTNYIVKCAQKVNEIFGIKMEVNDTCALCGLAYTSNFRTDAKFFGPDIDI